MTMLSAFHHFPKEGAAVGRMLAAYSDLEIGLMNAVQVARKDFDSVFKTMYRTRGETQRLDIGDALGRQIYAEQKLGTEFSMAVGAVRHCLRIRNQYSHCIWWNDNSGRLALADLETIAVSSEKVNDLLNLETRYVDMPLLIEQEAYFNHADDLLTWVNFERRARIGDLKRPPVFEKPKQLKRPALHIL
jgi:hypothetical protein